MGLFISEDSFFLTLFAKSCYEDRTITALENALERPSADRDDCRIWNVTTKQWRTAIAQALAAKRADAAETHTGN